MSGKYTLNDFAGSGPLFPCPVSFSKLKIPFRISHCHQNSWKILPLLLLLKSKCIIFRNLLLAILAKRARHFWDNSHTGCSRWDPLTESFSTFSQSHTCKRLQTGNSKMIKAFWLFQISNCDFVNQGHTYRHEQFGSPGHKLGPSTTEGARGVSPDRLKLQRVD